MKYYFWIILFFVAQGYSQSFVQWKDGRKMMIIEESFKVQPKHKRIVFQQTDSQMVKLKFKELDSAVVGNFRFKANKIHNKVRGNYELASSLKTVLLAQSTMKSRPAGGFEIPYTHYDLFIIDKNSEVVKFKTSFSSGNNTKDIARRLEALNEVKSHFKDCKKVIERISAIEAAEANIDRVIEEFIKVPIYVLCD